MWRVVSILTVLLGAAGARAQVGWVLTDASFKQQSVDLVSIDDKGLVLGADGRRMLVPLERFLEIARPASATESAEKFALYLANGDLVRGEPIGTARDTLSWKSSALGQLDISLRDVRAMVARGRTAEGLEAERREDTVLMANGDRVSGIVSSIDSGKVVMAETGATVAIAAVSHILFAAPAQKKRPAARAFRVKLTDGSTFSAPGVRLEGERLTLLLEGQGKRDLSLAAVTVIEQTNGPVAWLSAIAADRAEHIPFLDESFPPRMDRTVEDKPIRLGKTTFARGIGVHSHTVLEWELDGGFEALRTQYAIDEGRNEKADVTVRIKLDGKTVHERENFRAGVLSDVVMIPLAGARRLTLEAAYGGGIHTQGRLNWIEPALLRKMPEQPKPPVAPAPPPPPVTKPAVTKPATASGPASASAPTSREN
jgi:hypothetical protein